MAVLACVPRKSLHSRHESKRQHAVQLAASEDTEGRLDGMVCVLKFKNHLRLKLLFV